MKILNLLEEKKDDNIKRKVEWKYVLDEKKDYYLNEKESWI